MYFIVSGSNQRSVLTTQCGSYIVLRTLCCPLRFAFLWVYHIPQPSNIPDSNIPDSQGSKLSDKLGSVSRAREFLLLTAQRLENGLALFFNVRAREIYSAQEPVNWQRVFHQPVGRFAAALIFCVVLVFSASAAWAAPDLSGEEIKFGENAHGLGEGARIAKRTKIVVFKGYAKYKPGFLKLCSQLAEDGRRETLYHAIDSGIYRDDKCVACAPLIKVFANACRPLGQTRKAGAGAGKQIFKQREPEPRILDNTRQLFASIAADREIQFDTLSAIHKLLALMRDSNDKTPAEHEYLGILAEYIEGPFSEIEKEAKLRAERSQVPELSLTPRANVNDLFEN